MIAPHIQVFPAHTVQEKSAIWIADYLDQQLAKHQVLVLLSGGSAIPMYYEMFQNLIARRPSLTNLKVSLFDERYVPFGHPDSNETQLQAAGLFDLFSRAGVEWVSYLDRLETDSTETARAVTRDFEQLLRSHQLCILAGIGDDGHTAGLLPTRDKQTLTTVFDSNQLVEFYHLPVDSQNPFRERLTSTPFFVSQAEQVFVYAVGDKKRTALNTFLQQKATVAECPALCLSKSRSAVVVLTDQMLQ